MKILLTGAEGLLGSAILSVASHSPHEIVPTSRRDADLSNPEELHRLLRTHRPDALINTAAVVGGIELNRAKPEWMYEQNARLTQSVLGAAAEYGLPRALSFLSTCIFSPESPQPWTEEMIQSGEVDHRHWGYAKAKRELGRLSLELTERSGGRSLFSTLTPSTLYGANDYYGPDRSHVLAALTVKFHLAKTRAEPVTIWGTGRARREFLFAEDLARVVLWAIESYDDPETLIVAPEHDTSIAELAEMISKAMEFDQEITWDSTRPDGSPSRRTDAKKLAQLREVAFTPIEDGIRLTVDAFRERFPRIRGWPPQ